MGTLRRVNWAYVYSRSLELLDAAAWTTMYIMAGFSLLDMLFIGFPDSQAQFPDLFANIVLRQWWDAAPFSGDPVMHCMIIYVLVISKMFHPFIEIFRLPEENEAEGEQNSWMSLIMLCSSIALGYYYQAFAIYTVAVAAMLPFFGVIGCLEAARTHKKVVPVCSNPS